MQSHSLVPNLNQIRNSLLWVLRRSQDTEKQLQQALVRATESRVTLQDRIEELAVLLDAESAKLDQV